MCLILRNPTRIELILPRTSGVLPLHYTLLTPMQHNVLRWCKPRTSVCVLAVREGLEPTTFWLTVNCSTNWATEPCLRNNWASTRNRTKIWWLQVNCNNRYTIEACHWHHSRTRTCISHNPLWQYVSNVTNRPNDVGSVFRFRHVMLIGIRYETRTHILSLKGTWTNLLF